MAPDSSSGSDAASSSMPGKAWGILKVPELAWTVWLSTSQPATSQKFYFDSACCLSIPWPFFTLDWPHRSEGDADILPEFSVHSYYLRQWHFSMFDGTIGATFLSLAAWPCLTASSGPPLPFPLGGMAWQQTVTANFIVAAAKGSWSYSLPGYDSMADAWKSTCERNLRECFRCVQVIISRLASFISGNLLKIVSHCLLGPGRRI